MNTKYAMRGLMEGLYLELRQQNREHKVHLMSVAPFTVDTGMIRVRSSFGFLEQKSASILAPKPMNIDYNY